MSRFLPLSGQYSMSDMDYKSFFNNEPPSRHYHGEKAAGCIFVAKDTGRILLAHRADDESLVEEPGTWGTWGGKVDGDETPRQAVEREVEEETGHSGITKISLLYVYKDGSFEYHNFLVIVPFEFTPQLNWENDSSAWVEYGQWPEPMHFGLEALIRHAGPKIKRVIEALKTKKKNLFKEMDSPPSQIQSTHAFSDEFINYIKSVENGGKVGYKSGRWFPHASPEGGTPTIGYGHKLKPDEVERITKAGLSDDAVDRVLKSDLASARNKVYSDIKSMFDVQIPLDQRQEEILTDYVFNIGTLKGFPKLTKAVLNKDWATVSKEYKRTYKDANGTRHELARNKVFYDRYLKSVVNESEDVNVSRQGLIDVGVYGYMLTSPKSYISYGFEPDTKIYHLYMVQTPNESDTNKGYAKALLERFFQIIKKSGGALDVGPYTTSGFAFVKHVIERLAQKYNVRLI